MRRWRSAAVWLEAGGRAFDRRRSVLRLLLRGRPSLVAAYVSLSVVAGLVPAALMVASGVLTQRIADSSASDAGLAAAGVASAFAVVVGLFLLTEVLSPIQEQVGWRLTKQLDQLVRERAMRSAMAGADLGRLHDPELLEAMRRLRSVTDDWATPGGAAVGLVELARQYVAGVAAAALVAWFQPLIAALTLGVALLQRFRWRRVMQSLMDARDASQNAFAESRYFVELGLGRGSASEIRLFGLGRWLGPRIQAAGLSGWAPWWRARRRGSGRETALQFLVVGGAAAIALVWAARASGRGDLSTGGLVVFVTAMFHLVYGLGRVFATDQLVARGASAIPALETMERLADADMAVAGERPAAERPPALELRDVWFRYPGADDDVLRGVSLRIPAGESISLVGMNGAGKTTLVRLLCGLYQPARGQVLVDGVDVADLDVAAWQRRIAPMFQDFLRLQGTVAENVGIGAVERIGDRDGVRAAAVEAGVTAFADRLPDGLETPIASGEDDGQGLSGGEWQRIGIGRALFGLRAGAGLLVLDEPTSNLDTASEERLIRRLVDGTRGEATTLLVTHRLALARRTDTILVLEHGEIVERGTHEHLLAVGGRYADAFGMQAALYPLEEADDG